MRAWLHFFGTAWRRRSSGSGIPVRLQTGLGNDMFSRFAASELEKENVTLHNLSRGTEGIMEIEMSRGQRGFLLRI